MLLLSALSTLPAAAAGPSVADQLLGQVCEEILPNGLRVLVLERRAAPVVVTDLFYRVGSVHEEKGRTGLAHFLEHMMFKGTARLAKGEIDAVTLVHGGRNNAETWEDFTHYWFQFPADRWEKALEIEADRMAGLRIDPKEFEAEKKVVLEELRQGRDAPFGRLTDTALSAAYTAHPYRNPVIGYEPEIERLTAEDMTAFYKRHYRPENAVLVIVGDVKADAALAAARRHFAKVPGGNASDPPAEPAEPPQKSPRRFTMEQDSPVVRGMFLWHTVAEGHRDAAALELLAWVLGTGRSARLVGALQEDEDWTGEVEIHHDARRYGGQMILTVTAPAGYKTADLEAAVRKELRQVVRRGLERVELERARAGILADFQFAQEDPAALALGLGRAAVMGRWQGWAESRKALAAVTAADLKRVAKTYLTDDRLTVGFSLPAKNAAAAAPVGGASRSIARPGGKGDHRAADPAPIKGEIPSGFPTLSDPPPERFVLPNGLTVILQRRAVPVIALRAYVDAGVMREAKPGVAYLTGSLLDCGTRNRTAADIADEVENVGASLSVGSDGLALKVRPQDLGMAVDLAADLLMNSDFPEKELDYVRDAAASEVEDEAEDAEALAYARVTARIYGESHPLARNPRGTAEGLAKVSRRDVREHHRRWYVPGNTVIAVAGDFDPAAVRRRIEAAFGGWKGRKPAPPEHPAPMRADRGGREEIPKAREQVQIYFGHLGVRRSDPDWHALQVMDHVLGAGPGMTHRLARVLRDEKGLAYTVEASIADSAGVEPGVFLGYLAVKPANRREAVEGVLAEVRRAAAGDITAEEVRRAKAYLTGAWVFDHLTCEQVADRLVEIERFGLGLDHPERYVRAVDAVTVEQVRKAAARHLSVEALHVVQVGPVE
jgi:zinc protease